MYAIHDLQTFVAVGKTGGISAAAKSLGISVATASHRIAKLEGVLNLRLFHRNSRAVRLTDEGIVFLERVEPLLAELREAELEAGGGTGQIRGHLRVTMSPWILSRFILPLMDAFLDDHPDLSVDFLAVDRFVPLVEEGVDCAIRVGTLRDSSLKARKICSNNRVICAAPSFLDRYGVPDTLDALRLQRWACLPWQTRFDLTDPLGRVVPFSPVRKIAVSNSDMLTEVAVQGLGVAVKSRLGIAQELDDGALVEVLPGRLHSADAPISFVHAAPGSPGHKVRAFSELAERAFVRDT